MQIFAHSLGIIAMLILISSLQIHDKKKLVIMQTAGVVCFSLHYFLIGAYSGAALNLICAIRNLIYYRRTARGENGVLIPIIFALLIIIASVFSWDGYHSLFIISGLVINTLGLGLLGTQNFRKSLLISCPLVLIYNVFELSVGGIVNETLSIISATIGILRYIKKKR